MANHERNQPPTTASQSLFEIDPLANTRSEYSNRFNEVGDVDSPLTELVNGQYGPLLDFELRLFAERISHEQGRLSGAVSALSSTRATLMPHQVRVAHWAVHNPFTRGLVLADEVGLGKTVEAAIIMKELICRGKGSRILILVPAKLVGQWQHELREKINEEFHILTGKEVRELAADSRSPWVEHNRVLASIELARTFRLADSKGSMGIGLRPWDVLVVDEAHCVKDATSANYHLVSQIPREHTLFLTATPIRNYAWDLFHLATVLETREEKPLGTKYSFRKTFLRDGKGLQIKNAQELAERLQKFLIRNTKARVPEIYQVKRVGRTFHFQPGEEEAAFQTQAEDYIYGLYRDGRSYRGEFYKVLLATALRKLAASSRQAVLPTLEARKQRLEELLALGLPEGAADALADVDDAGPVNESEVPEAIAQPVLKQRTAPEKLERMREEVRDLTALLAESAGVTANAKLEALLGALRGLLLPQEEKVLVFTEYKRTQHMLVTALAQAGYRVEAFHGGLPHARPGANGPQKSRRPAGTREEVFVRFQQPGPAGVQILVATEAAAEGLNLQFCHVVVNYDLPWNPQRIEQRVGRVHRIGQTRDVLVVNLAAQGSIDDELLVLLQEKIRLFNTVLGESELILGAIDEAQVLNFEEKLMEIAAQARGPDEVRRAMVKFRADMDAVLRDRQDRMRQELRDFDDRVTDHLTQVPTVPNAVQQAVRVKHADVLNFVTRYLKKYGLALRPVAPAGVFEFDTPAALRARVPQLAPRYRGAFDQETAALAIDADFIALGHPFLTAAVEECLVIGRTARVRLDYTGADRKLHGFDGLAGRVGVWANLKVTFRSFDSEQSLLSAFVSRSGPEPDDFNARMLYYRLLEHPVPDPGLDFVKDALSGAVDGPIGRQLERLRLLNREVFEEEAAKIDTYFEDSLMEFEDKEQTLLRQMERVQARRQKARVFDERKALREEYETLKEQYFRLQRDNFRPTGSTLLITRIASLRQSKNYVELVPCHWEISYPTFCLTDQKG
jgi:superfamily II DNA or RNA helicase